jgi:hypothetical protein
MDAIEAIAFAGGAGFAVVVVGTIIVIIGVRHEEHLKTLTRQHPPSVPALLARLVLRTYAQLSTGQHGERNYANPCECDDRRRTEHKSDRE